MVQTLCSFCSLSTSPWLTFCFHVCRWCFEGGGWWYSNIFGVVFISERSFATDGLFWSKSKCYLFNVDIWYRIFIVVEDIIKYNNTIPGPVKEITGSSDTLLRMSEAVTTRKMAAQAIVENQTRPNKEK